MLKVTHPIHSDIVAYDLPGRKTGTSVNGIQYFKQYKLKYMSVVLVVYESDLEDSHFTMARACSNAGIPIAFVHSKADQGLQHVLTANPDLKLAVRQMRNEVTCVIERLCRNRGMSLPNIFLISSREYQKLSAPGSLITCQFDEEALLCWIFSHYRTVNPTVQCPLEVFFRKKSNIKSSAHVVSDVTSTINFTRDSIAASEDQCLSSNSSFMANQDIPNQGIPDPIYSSRREVIPGRLTSVTTSLPVDSDRLPIAAKYFRGCLFGWLSDCALASTIRLAGDSRIARE
eukprot:Gregarina_sp_Poly_1__7520@NODE_419_length_8686_cov_338_596705_g341_i0_p4_GENE_NODE_419_length_8686_cov_338_596705_g341_i0NODE_419_length_8686_cov_338_596705_g341_i0_p4_ORF_typecomplete_len287_score17_04IIGP/PF05049_13/4_8e17_NODE_419_length_8686_cov_338_596705_g341_i036074467